MLEQLPGQSGVEHLDEVFGLDLDSRPVELHHETERQLRELTAQLGALTGDSGRVEAIAVGAARTERHASHPFHTVASIGVEFGHHPVEVDPLMGECADRDVAGLGHRFAECLTPLWTQPHRDRVAVVADDVVEVGGPVEHRCRDEEVVGVGVPVDEHSECGQQHHVRGGAGLLGGSGHALHGRIG